MRNDVAERVLLPLQHAHRLRVPDHFGAAVGSYRHQGRIGRVAQQPLVKFELAGQIGFRQRLARSREQGRGH